MVFDPTLVVPASKRDPKEMWQELMEIAKRIENRHLRRLVGLVYRETRKN
jgi:hypothetical protein